MTDRDEALAPSVGKPPLKQRLSALFEEYGKVAIITYLALSLLAIAGFSVAIWIGAEPSSATGVLGVLFAGWALGKATMPLRILLTLGLTPVIAMVVRRLRPPDAPPVVVEPPIEPPPVAKVVQRRRPDESPGDAS